jgi:hypothetical protein
VNNNELEGEDLATLKNKSKGKLQNEIAGKAEHVLLLIDLGYCILIAIQFLGYF